MYFYRQASDAGRSASPASDGGNASDERTDLRGKTKAKGKKTGEGLLPFISSFSDSTTNVVDESDFTLKRKRVFEIIPFDISAIKLA